MAWELEITDTAHHSSSSASSASHHVLISACNALQFIVISSILQLWSPRFCSPARLKRWVVVVTLHLSRTGRSTDQSLRYHNVDTQVCIVGEATFSSYTMPHPSRLITPLLWFLCSSIRFSRNLSQAIFLKQSSSLLAFQRYPIVSLTAAMASTISSLTEGLTPDELALLRDQNSDGELYSCAATFSLLAIASVVLRVTSRHMKNVAFGLDDALVIIALVILRRVDHAQ